MLLPLTIAHQIAVASAASMHGNAIANATTITPCCFYLPSIAVLALLSTTTNNDDIMAVFQKSNQTPVQSSRP